MAWYSDEAWEMISDSINKKNVARSASSMRTHCGKRGAVKFPSDFMSRKDLKAMNGEVETYRMNEPMSWDEFVKMPIDLQRKYIQHLRDKFNAPDQYVAEMFGKSHSVFLDHLFRLKMSADKWMEGNTWDREGFMAWRLGVDVGETEPVPVVENKEEETMDILNRPMKFTEFSKLTDAQKKEYIENLRIAFDVPNSYLAKMFGVSDSCVSNQCRKLEVGHGRPTGSKRAWDVVGWSNWLNGKPDVAAPVVETEETTPADVVEENETPHLTERDKEKLDNYVQDLIELSGEVMEYANAKVEKKIPAVETFDPMVEIKPLSRIPIIPRIGEMNFVGDADDILTTLSTLLSGARVNLTVSWDIVE